MALQGQGPDPSERIFVELRSKNEEVKSKAAAELRDLITLLSRGQHSLIHTGFLLLTVLQRMVAGTIRRVLRQSHKSHQQPHRPSPRS